jgi:parallel beta-helix repeat protein
MLTRIHLKSIFAALALALGNLLSPNLAANTTSLAATTYLVNDAGVDCGSFTATYVSIRAAVTDAIANRVKTILVCPGSYNNFSVVGANKLTIKSALAGTFPTINAPAASSGKIVDVRDSTGVVLDGLNIDGTNFNDALSGEAYGVIFDNASGTIQNSSVTRVRCFPNSCSLGVGIYVLDNNNDGKRSTLTVKNVNVTDVDDIGIYAFGPAKLSVVASRITGDLSGGTDINPVGVYFSFSGVTGSVIKSTISNVSYGVFVSGASNVTVSGNTIEDAFFYGVRLSASCIAGNETSSSNKVTDNTFSDMSLNGVSIASFGGGCSSYADKNTISGNRITGNRGGAGVVLSVNPGASADRNKIAANTIFGFRDGVVTDPNATKTSVSKNTWVP